MFKRFFVFLIVFSMFVSNGYCAVRFGNGTKTVATSGTALAITSTSQDANTLIVCGDSGNTGKIIVGASPVAAAGSQQGIVLSAGACAPIYTSARGRLDISTIKVDATVSGEEASYFWMLEER